MPLQLLRHISAQTYAAIGNSVAVNDFVFSYTLAPEVSTVQRTHLLERCDEMLGRGLVDTSKYQSADTLAKAILHIRDTLVPKYLDDCVERVVALRPTLVGFSCLFDQTVASIALAKRLRAALPGATIGLGGYSVGGSLAAHLLSRFDWLDFVALGDGEETILELAEASVGQKNLVQLGNVVARGAKFQATPARVALSDVPTPNFDDFFQEIADLAETHRVHVRPPVLPVEASRGCWWGQVKHCTFCGIDEEALKYRQKKPEDVLKMLGSLHSRYGIDRFRFNDYILPLSYFDELLPQLATRKPRYKLYCETKANLNRTKFLRFRDAGFSEIQPGIESFLTPVLKAMDKGVSGLQNIQTLVLGKLCDIAVHYNILFGFPSDAVVNYRELLTIVPHLYHLDPPYVVGPVQITRFAPLQVDSLRFPQTATTQHHRLYEIIFSKQYLDQVGFDLDEYAYYFEQRHQPTSELNDLYGVLLRQVEHWRLARARAATLSYEECPGGITLFDSRYDATGFEVNLDHVAATVLQMCSGEVISVNRLVERMSDTAQSSEIHRAIDELKALRVVISEGPLLLGIAVPSSEGP